MHEQSGQKQRLSGDLRYAADRWAWERRVIAKAEVTEKGRNLRFVVTILEGEAQALMTRFMVRVGRWNGAKRHRLFFGQPLRGEAKPNQNRINEQQLGLFSDRTSAHGWWANPLRVSLSAAACVIVDTMQRVALKGTKWGRAQAGTIRLKLLKLGTVVVRYTRRIRLLLSSAYPYYQGLFNHVAIALRF